MDVLAENREPWVLARDRVRDVLIRLWVETSLKYIASRTYTSTLLEEKKVFRNYDNFVLSSSHSVRAFNIWDKILKTSGFLLITKHVTLNIKKSINNIFLMF